MPQISPVLRSYTCKVTGRKGHGWWCPGCKHAHYVQTDGGDKPTWGFDGNVDKPTFSPSFRQFIPAMPTHPREECRKERTTCHCFVKAGVIQFLNDSPHALKGQTVPMVLLDTITDYRWGYD